MPDGDVFAIPDFWKTSPWLDLARHGNGNFFDPALRATNKTESTYLSAETPDVTSDDFFKLPTALQPLDFSGFGHDKSEPAKSSHERPPKRRWQDVDLFDDAWIKKEDTPLYHAEYKSWDGFTLPEIPPAQPLFITEAGPAAYDAALHSSDGFSGIKNHGHNVVQTNPYVAALLALALGRASIFFTWNEKTGSFIQDLDKLRISGYSTDVLEGLQKQCLECGNITRFLYIFVQVTYKTHPSAGRVAFAKAVDSLLLVLQTKLGGQSRKVGSLLQLQAFVQPVHGILSYFNSLVTKVNKARTDEQILSILFEETQSLDHRDDLLSNLIREVLARVSEPWSDFVQKWVGLRVEEGSQITKEGPGKSFVRVENVAYLDDFGTEVEDPDYVLDERRIPSFIPAETAQTMFETGRNLRLLRTHHPDHPLTDVSFIGSRNPPEFRWYYDWNAIEQMQKNVDEYETSLLLVIRQDPTKHQHSPVSHTGYDLQLFGQEKGQLVERLVTSIKELNQPPPAVNERDSISQLLYDRLFEENDKGQDELPLTPHWSLLPLLSFGPLIEAQSRLINREYMKLLFTSHKLRDHITLQRDFQLLGNGLFCSRLSHALFDPELETAERQAGVARNGGVMGLRLGSRDTWPPASSELRLALMGVLSESYVPLSGKTTKDTEKHDLPGDLSFAVRDLSDEEIEKCMNPESLEALDFLRLSYKPPAPLAPVLTPVILIKYDKIFKMLLRVLRMLYVAGELYSDTNARTSHWNGITAASLRFRIEAQHFISCITTYFFDTGIAAPWTQFDRWLAKVQAELEDEELAQEKGRVVSPDRLRQYHEQVLDSVMHTLFLRKRQHAILGVLEDIFTLILQFSKLARLEATGKSQGYDGPSPKTLYAAFKKKVHIFITVCRGLSEREGSQTKSTGNSMMVEQGLEGLQEENTIDQLLIQLEMSGYYGGSR